MHSEYLHTFFVNVVQRCTAFSALGCVTHCQSARAARKAQNVQARCAAALVAASCRVAGGCCMVAAALWVAGYPDGAARARVRLQSGEAKRFVQELPDPAWLCNRLAEHGVSDQLHRKRNGRGANAKSLRPTWCELWRWSHTAWCTRAPHGMVAGGGIFTSRYLAQRHGRGRRLRFGGLLV